MDAPNSVGCYFIMFIYRVSVNLASSTFVTQVFNCPIPTPTPTLLHIYIYIYIKGKGKGVPCVCCAFVGLDNKQL